MPVTKKITVQSITVQRNPAPYAVPCSNKTRTRLSALVQGHDEQGQAVTFITDQVLEVVESLAATQFVSYRCPAQLYFLAVSAAQMLAPAADVPLIEATYQAGDQVTIWVNDEAARDGVLRQVSVCTVTRCVGGGA